MDLLLTDCKLQDSEDKDDDEEEDGSGSSIGDMVTDVVIDVVDDGVPVVTSACRSRSVE